MYTLFPVIGPFLWFNEAVQSFYPISAVPLDE